MRKVPFEESCGPTRGPVGTTGGPVGATGDPVGSTRGPVRPRGGPVRLTKGHFGSRRQIVTDCGCRPKAVVRQVLGHGGIKVVPGWRQHAATVPGDGHAALGRMAIAWPECILSLSIRDLDLIADSCNVVSSS